MDVVETVFHFWPYFGLLFLAFLAITAYALTDSESRSQRRLKRRVRKFGLFGTGAVFAFAASLSVGLLLGTIGSHDATDPNSSPIYLVMGFLVVMLSAVFVGFLVIACVRVGKSRRLVTVR